MRSSVRARLNAVVSALYNLPVEQVDYRFSPTKGTYDILVHYPVFDEEGDFAHWETVEDPRPIPPLSPDRSDVVRTRSVVRRERARKQAEPKNIRELPVR